MSWVDKLRTEIGDFTLSNVRARSMRVKHSTIYGVNPKIPAPADRPCCNVRGCKSPRAIISCTNDGSPVYRKVCSTHHSRNIAAKHGVSSISKLTAQRQGMTVTEYKNQHHPYLKFRKDYCENVDGRLGFACTTNIVWNGMLDVDHKNGKPNDNRPRNLQTLCKCCHSFKSNMFQDYKSPGRKALGIKR